MQADIAIKHESIGKLHSRVQNLTDLLVQAQYNVTHDLPVIAEQAIPDTKIQEQVRKQNRLKSCLQASFAFNQ